MFLAGSNVFVPEVVERRRWFPEVVERRRWFGLGFNVYVRF